MNILFVHDGIGQFRVLHEYLNRSGLANSWLACSQNNYRAKKDQIAKLLPFTDSAESDGYYYTRRLEQRIKRSFGIKQAVQNLLKTEEIDIIVVHGTGGFPLQLFDEFDIPIVTYIEFPSYAAHGHDKRYPPPEAARYVDKLFEMVSFHSTIKSELVIVPSLYARNLFPEILRSKVFAQVEGFNLPTESPRHRRDGPLRIGFAARDLSSAKGVEDFILIAKRIAQRLPQAEFHICGSKTVLYSYERDFIKSQNLGADATFFDYLLQREGIELGDRFHHHSFLPYDQYAQLLDDMDIMLYPLRHGSLNWGLIEMLLRGKIVIASNRCFVPEVIHDRVNGFLRDIDDHEAWVEQVLAIAGNRETFGQIGFKAAQMARERFDIACVAPKFLDLFTHAIQTRKCRYPERSEDRIS